MEAQRLLDAAPFAPDIVKSSQVAFENAWASLASTIAPDRVSDTRVSLAHAIIAHATAGDHDAESSRRQPSRPSKGIHHGYHPWTHDILPIR
jgi:hypothetical protein